MRRWSRDLPVYMKMSEVILVAVSNIFYFHPYLVKWSNLTNIFRMGWNHQLVMFKKIWESFPPVAGKSMFDKIWIVECDIQHTNKKKDKLAKQKPQNIRSTFCFLQNLFFFVFKACLFFFPALDSRVFCFCRPSSESNCRGNSFFFHIQNWAGSRWAMKKTWLVGLYRGWKTTQYVGVKINHLRIPINQPGFNGT